MEERRLNHDIRSLTFLNIYAVYDTHNTTLSCVHIDNSLETVLKWLFFEHKHGQGFIFLNLSKNKSEKLSAQTYMDVMFLFIMERSRCFHLALSDQIKGAPDLQVRITIVNIYFIGNKNKAKKQVDKS